MTALLDVRRLCAGYGAGDVVADVDLSVDRGEVVALLGPNGAGKSTTLLAISGLVAVSSGEIEIFGSVSGSTRRTRPARATVARRARSGLAHVPEDRALFGGLTVADNIALGVSSTRARREVAAAVQRSVDLFPVLEPLLARNANLLSGGEQQMLAIARALASSPRLLMIDELSLGLAPLVVAELMPVLRRIADDDGTGVLLVEQHVPMALQVADRAVLLSRGRVLDSGPADRFADDPTIVASAYLGEA